MLSGCVTSGHITATSYRVSDTDEFTDTDVVAVLGWPDSTTSAMSSLAQVAREQGRKFQAKLEKDVRVYGDHDGDMTIQISAVSVRTDNNRFPAPTELTIQTLSGHALGEKTTDGKIELRFGVEEPIYTSEPSGAHTRFELTIQNIYTRDGDKWVAGFYQAFVANKANPSDKKGIFIVNGVFDQRISN